MIGSGSPWRYQRLVLVVVAALTVAGVAAWSTMDRQEDPSLPYRFAHVTVEWPGASAERMRRLVLEPLEDELAGVERIDELRSTARPGSAHILVGMDDRVRNTTPIWERARQAIARAERDFPDGVAPVALNDRSMDTDAILIAVTGSDDLVELADAARDLRRDLFGIDGVDRIELIADPGRQISLRVDHAAVAAVGLTTRGLAAQVAGRNAMSAGGPLIGGGRSIVLEPGTTFASLDELAATPIRTAGGAFIPLAELAGVMREPRAPARERMWHDGQPAVGVALMLADDRTHAVRTGQAVRAALEELRPRYAPLELNETFFQPDQVAQRLHELGRTLLVAALIVALALLAFMSLRLGLVVAAIVPLVTLAALALYAAGGGVLHQMAIAGMVIALGMLVDNAIVVTETVQWHLDRGRSRARATMLALGEVARPLAVATGTTLAAFLPLLAARGDTADFTRSIPTMIMLMLATSYAFALLVVPLVAGRVLQPRHGAGASDFERMGGWLGRRAVRHRRLIVSGAMVLIAASAIAFTFVDRDFFPSTDRNQLVIDLHLPAGTPLTETVDESRHLAAEIGEHSAVDTVHHFAGSTGARFYYNLAKVPLAPQLARLVAVTTSADELPSLKADIRRIARENWPQADLIVRRLGQGPMVEAPVEMRVFSEDGKALAAVTERVLRIVRDDPGTRDVRHQLGEGVPTLRFVVNDAAAARHGVERADAGRALATVHPGEVATTWLADREPAPLLVQAAEGKHLSLAALDGLPLSAEGGATVPLGHVAEMVVELQPAVIRHQDRQRMSPVLAETQPGVTYAEVMQRIEPAIDELDLPPGTRVETAGLAAESTSANAALLRTLPLAAIPVLALLFWQFNSFRRVAIVMATLPLAAVAVPPVLLIAQQPLSFMSLLGAVALAGIVLNNAIMLVDRAGLEFAAGVSVAGAIEHAVARRTRPVLLTAGTTIAGLVPLTFTQSTLWPPLAWTLIGGLAGATVLTLVVIPALLALAWGARK